LIINYDVVKTHGGEIKVEKKGGEGVEFVIQLPNTNMRWEKQ
jgi:signal transduction histidine kinase